MKFPYLLIIVFPISFWYRGKYYRYINGVLGILTELTRTLWVNSVSAIIYPLQNTFFF